MEHSLCYGLQFQNSLVTLKRLLKSLKRLQNIKLLPNVTQVQHLLIMSMVMDLWMFTKHICLQKNWVIKLLSVFYHINAQIDNRTKFTQVPPPNISIGWKFKMEKHSLILLIAFAASSVLLLFENTQNLSLYIFRPLASLNTTMKNSNSNSIKFGDSLSIPLTKTRNNLYTLPVVLFQNQPEYNLLINSSMSFLY